MVTISDTALFTGFLLATIASASIVGIQMEHLIARVKLGTAGKALFRQSRTR